MKIAKNIYEIVLALTFSFAAALKAQDLYVSCYYGGAVGEYGLDASTVNASLLSFSDFPWGLPVSGNGTIGEYTTGGSVVDASLISGLVDPENMCIDPVPEPSAGALAALSAAALWLWRHRK
ncbi:MAG: PEP-CTERM sorting domain-containing protein [Verrucomicrobiota bacterium]|jgi:MYXO-CTERM domain-containing protein